MSERPEPPVPAECTMGGNDWFPWYFDRLRKSKWWRRASDMARARNVMLWGEAYKGVPAGSLPDDDDELAEAAGFGMNVEDFAAVKAEIMSAWTLCSDGRWYHPTVCEVVLERWESTSEKRKAAAAKKRAQREKSRGVPAKNDAVPPNGRDVPGDIHGNGGDTPSDSRARMIGHDTTDKTDNPHSPQGGEEAFDLVPDEEHTVDEVLQAFDLWNDTAVLLGLPKAKDLTDGRRRAIRKRLETGGIDGWREAMAAVCRSRHLRGGNDRKWKADLDFVCQAKSYQRLKEGFYGDDAEAPKPPGPNGHTAADPWRYRMLEWTKNRFWKDLDWGPRPGKPGCEVPTELLAQLAEPAA
jgi:hypothetical protein